MLFTAKENLILLIKPLSWQKTPPSEQIFSVNKAHGRPQSYYANMAMQL